MVAGIPDATVFQNQGQGQPIESGLGRRNCGMIHRRDRWAGLLSYLFTLSIA